MNGKVSYTLRYLAAIRNGASRGFVLQIEGLKNGTLFKLSA